VDLTRAILLVALALAGCGGNDADNADLGSEALIGREFVKQRGCAQCHQAPRSGAPTLGGGVEVMPGVFSANLTPDGETGLGHWADITIVRAMRYGIDDEQMSLCPPMPHFDGSDPKYPFMTDVEANAIVAYLRSLKPVDNAVPESECPPIKPRPPVDMAVPAATDDMTPVDHD
jgi:mono/diheme cytochrome c family protein